MSKQGLLLLKLWASSIANRTDVVFNSLMVTIHDIARETGVSPNTVARILAGKRGRPYNESKVLSLAQKYGYVRNQQASSLRTGRSNLIGMIVPDIQNPHYPAFYQQVHDAAVADGYHILLSSTFGRVSEEKQALRLFEMNRVAGIILNTAEGEADESCDALLETFIKRNVPVIICGRSSRGLAVDESIILNEEASARAIAYLFKTGHRRIAFLSGPGRTLAAHERLAGYRRGLKECGLESNSHPIREGQFTIASGTDMTRDLLELPERPTAILAANDLLAIGAIQAIQGTKLVAGRDIAVIGFGDNPLSEIVSPKLTSLRIPTQRIAYDCVHTLLDRLAQGEASPPRRFVYEAELIIRESA